MLYRQCFFFGLCGSQAEAQNTESEQTVLYPQIIIILIGYYYILLNY
jgi:hypothetical protein